jgi:GT2 family glycosyltransferase
MLSMPYLITAIELTEPVPCLSIPVGHTGIACVVRRNGTPLGFFMKAAAPGTQFAPEEVARIIAENVERRLLDAGDEDCAGRTCSVPFPSLTVAICTRDRRDDLARCLNSLLRLRAPTPAGLPQFEILVVDNAPSDCRTQQLVGALPGVRYAHEPKPGLNFARNRAIRESGELLAYVDDDVVVDDGWLEGLKAAWAENPDAGLFTGPILPDELVTDAQVLFEERGGFSHNFAKTRLDPDRKTRDCYYYGFGCNMVLKRDLLREIGGFDEALDTGSPLPGGGDLDISYRLLRAGYPLVSDPRLLVYHRHRREYRDLRHQMWTWGLTFMTFMAKCHQTDPPRRSQCRRAIGHCFGSMLLDLLPPAVRGRNGRWVPGLALVELFGSVAGLCNQYGRSQKRIVQIRRRHALEDAG